MTILAFAHNVFPPPFSENKQKMENIFYVIVILVLATLFSSCSKAANKQESFFIGKIKIDIKQEGDDAILFANDTSTVQYTNRKTTHMRKVVLNNYNIAKAYFSNKAEKVISSEEMDEMILELITYHTYTNHDIEFTPETFNSTESRDIIIFFIKNKYPKEYFKKCEIILGMTPSEFEEYEKYRSFYFNK